MLSLKVSETLSLYCMTQVGNYAVLYSTLVLKQPAEPSPERHFQFVSANHGPNDLLNSPEVQVLHHELTTCEREDESITLNSTLFNTGRMCIVA